MCAKIDASRTVITFSATLELSMLSIRRGTADAAAAGGGGQVQTQQ